MNTFQCQQLLSYTSQGRLRCVVVLPVASLNQLAVHRDEDVLWPGRFALRVLVQKLLVLDAWSLAPRGTQAFLPCPVRLVPAWTFEKAVSLDSSAPVPAYGGKIMRKTSTTTVPCGAFRRAFMCILSRGRSFWYHQRHDESQSPKGSKKSNTESKHVPRSLSLRKAIRYPCRVPFLLYTCFLYRQSWGEIARDLGSTCQFTHY